jgi:hypothetical protein
MADEKRAHDNRLYGKDAESATTGVYEAPPSTEEPLTGWRARIRRGERALGIEAQGIARVHECASLSLAL